MYAGARHEADRGIEVSADALVLERDVPEVVRIVDLESVRASIGAGILAIHRQRPHADQEVLVPAKARRRVGEVDAAHPAPGSTQRIADGRDTADPRFAPEVLFDAPDRH